MDEGRVQVLDGASIAAWRDATATVVGICGTTSSVGDTPVTLGGDGRPLEAGGGLLTQEAAGWISYSIFPPTFVEEVSIRSSDQIRALVRFGPLAASDCQLRAGEGLRIEACGMLMRVSWRTRLRYKPDEIELIDARVGDVGRPSNYGFFFHQARRENGHLWIDFAFRRPETNNIKLSIDRLYIRNGKGRIKELTPHISDVFRILPID